MSPPSPRLLSHYFYAYKLTQLQLWFPPAPFPLICQVAKGVFNTYTPLATVYLGLLSCVFSHRDPWCALHPLCPRRFACRLHVVRWFEFCVGGMSCAVERVWLTASCVACVGFNKFFFFHVCNLIFSFCCLFLQLVVPPADVTTGTFTHLIRCSLPRAQTQTHSSDVASDNGRRDLRNVLCFSFVQWHKKRKEKLTPRQHSWQHCAQTKRLVLNRSQEIFHVNLMLCSKTSRFIKAQWQDFEEDVQQKHHWLILSLFSVNRQSQRGTTWRQSCCKLQLLPFLPFFYSTAIMHRNWMKPMQQQTCSTTFTYDLHLCPSLCLYWWLIGAFCHRAGVHRGGYCSCRLYRFSSDAGHSQVRRELQIWHQR